MANKEVEIAPCVEMRAHGCVCDVVCVCVYVCVCARVMWGVCV